MVRQDNFVRYVLLIRGSQDGNHLLQSLAVDWDQGQLVIVEAGAEAESLANYQALRACHPV